MPRTKYNEKYICMQIHEKFAMLKLSLNNHEVLFNRKVSLHSDRKLEVNSRGMLQYVAFAVLLIRS